MRNWKRVIAASAASAIVAILIPATQASATGEADNGYVAAEAVGQVKPGGTCPVAAGDRPTFVPQGGHAAKFLLVVLSGLWGPGTEVADAVPSPTAVGSFLTVNASITACVNLIPVLGTLVVNWGTLGGLFAGTAITAGSVTGWFIQAGTKAVAQLDVNWTQASVARNADETANVTIAPAGTIGLQVLVNPVGDVVVAVIGGAPLQCDVDEASCVPDGLG
jgi:hypothetical protein